MQTPWFVKFDLDDNKGNLSAAKCAAALVYAVCILLFSVSGAHELVTRGELSKATLTYVVSLIAGSIAALFGRATFTAWLRQRHEKTDVAVTADESERLDDDDRAA
jgi:protein-S-isoprenylcysteine O-methyltransferase Ste14